MTELSVYVADGCWGCEESVKIADELRDEFPDVAVDVIDAEPDELPDEVFAVPTWLLNGRVISLGNPTRQQLRERLATLPTTTRQ